MNSNEGRACSTSTVDRRNFLRAVAMAGPAMYVAQRAEGPESGSLLAADSIDSPAGSTGLIIRQKQPENLEFPFSELQGFITPNEQFYIRNHFPAPSIDATAWSLKVAGAVDRTIELSYDELLEMPSKIQTVTLECAGNGRVFLVPQTKGAQWELGAASNAEWTGVPLSAVLRRAGLKKSAVDVVLEGADEGEVKDPPKPAGKIRFHRSIPLSKALDDVLLATKMNGQPLPVSHGFPLRAIVPGWYAMASIKWLGRILVTEQPYHGYYQSVDYAYWERKDGLQTRVPITEMQVKSQIARPAVHEVVKRGTEYRVFGAAWTGDSEIKKVEVSTDGGKTFAEAKLIGEPVRYAWRLWEYTWSTPRKAGRCTLLSRATDQRGQTQVAERDGDRENYMINHLLPVEVIVQ